MSKEIRFHSYALYKMERRNLTRSVVEETAKEPLSVVEGKFGRKEGVSNEDKICEGH